MSDASNLKLGGCFDNPTSLLIRVLSKSGEVLKDDAEWKRTGLDTRTVGSHPL